MFELKLPAVKFSLPEWRPRDLEFMQEQASHLRYVAEKAGQASDGMKKHAAEMLNAASRGLSLAQQVHSGKDIRSILMLWLHYNEEGELFAEKVRPTLELLNRFKEVRPQLSRLALYEMAQVYFDHYDRIPDLQLFSGYLKDQFAKQVFSGRDSSLALLALSNDVVFGSEAPARIVDDVVNRGVTLHDALTNLGIPETEGMFRERCTALYFISSLERLQPGEDSHLFAEILQSKVVNAPYKGGLLIGHAVLNILIGLVIQSGLPMPENWMKIILTIAGDPRAPTMSRNFQYWWQRLDQSYIEQVRGWLSRFDLDLFLRAFEAFANQSGDEDLRRMFPARKRFLEGLFEHGLIGNTRLFIGRHASQFLKNNYDDKELPVYAGLDHKDKSIIYMNVAGLHIIEGSHSAKFWIFDRLPDCSNILNYNVIKFSQSELGNDLDYWYHREFCEKRYGASNIPIGIIHYPNVTWQRKAIQAFEKSGINLDVEKLLTPEDYRIYKQKYGLTYYS